jgi:hypothetical protein
MKKKMMFTLALTIFGMMGIMAVGHETFAAGRQGKFQLGTGAGLAVNPVAFDLNLNGEYFAWENISLGMNLDVLIRSSAAFAFIPFARYHFDIDRAPEWVPYVGLGVGGIVSTSGNGALDIMVPDVGVRYEAISDRLFLGTDMSGHVVTDFDSTKFDFRWLIITASYRF